MSVGDLNSAFTCFWTMGGTHRKALSHNRSQTQDLGNLNPAFIYILVRSRPDANRTNFLGVLVFRVHVNSITQLSLLMA